MPLRDYSGVKTILITGCSAKSIGSALAMALAQRGHHIFATARSPEKIPNTLTSLDNVTPLQLDVTSPTSVSDAVKAVQESSRGLDILVNNAGIGYTMPLLDAKLDEARNVYETNVWGVLRVVQGFSDLLIAARGKIVNVSTVGAVVNTPWIGIYSSSKSALNQLSETLRLELFPFGVSVICLMVGTVQTSFHANEPPAVITTESRYTVIRETISRWSCGEAGPRGCSIEQAAEKIIRDVLGSRGGIVWRGPNSAAIRFLAAWCPRWLLDRIMSKEQGLDELEKSLAE
ncbi:hypothetical protein BJY04DRAFT_226628 [Aspergillus karnatakaensis]|uniref:SDR family oxidoreductase n=1 Tax=Aspergillus karnatakaensis TaxID=1810916 RepID=UPI003CCD2C17